MKLVLMGDLHYHDIDETIPGWREARSTFYETLLERFLEIDANYHISLGDLTNIGSTSEVREVFEMINRRKDRTFIHVLGNHDLYAQKRNEVLSLTGGQRYHSIETDKATLVFLDTAKEMDYDDWGGWVDDEQLQWLEDIVKRCGTKTLLVFAHHPVYKTTLRSELDKNSIHPSIDMWRILSQKKGKAVYFNGHTHSDSIVEQNGWAFVQLSACLDQPGFRVVEIDKEQIRISAVDIADEAVYTHAPMLHRNMKYFQHKPDARGKETDRGIVIPLLSAVNPL